MRRLALMGLGVMGVCCGFTTAMANESYVAWKRQLGTEKNNLAVGVAADDMGHVYMAGSTLGALAGVSQGSSDA